MRVSQAKELFRSLLSGYFSGAEVTYTRQSRVAKPKVPLVTITPGNVRRPRDSVSEMVDGTSVAYYQSRISMQVDLFTSGKPVIDEDTGAAVAYENTAVDDMLAFADFLGSQYVIEWCRDHDVSILIDGDVQDLTGLVNDNNYEFRSRLSALFFFTQKTVGPAAVLSEESIQYPTGEVDAETGMPIYSPDEPKQTASSTGGSDEAGAKDAAAIVPKFEKTSSGGGTEELAKQEAGYFTEVEIKEETGNE